MLVQSGWCLADRLVLTDNHHETYSKKVVKMDSFENKRYMFAEFWTPIRQKDERMKVKVPKWDKCRSKSDSNSPFPDNYFDTQTRKFTKVSENAFHRQEKSVSRCASHPRTPLQTLNKTVEVAKANVQKTAPRILISEHFTKTKSTLDDHLRAERTPVSHRSRNFSSWNSSYIPRSTFINGPIGNETDIRKKFIIYDESRATTSKENNEQQSSSINLIQDLNLVSNYSDENSQREILLSSYQGRNEKNVNTGVPTPCKTQSICIQNKRSERKMISSPLKTEVLETLPPVEKIGAPFWDADEGNIEDLLSLEDIIRSANIWDIKENNNNYYCCSSLSDGLFEYFPELQMMQEPFFPMELEPATIEVPWNES